MGPASCMSASSWSAYMMISLKNVMQYEMDKEEKPHTPRNVSRIFMFTTALQCSILSLSLLFRWLDTIWWLTVQKVYNAKRRVGPSWLVRSSSLLVLQHSNFLRKSWCTDHSGCANTPSCRSTLAIEASPWTSLEALEKLQTNWQRATEFGGQSAEC